MTRDFNQNYSYCQNQEPSTVQYFGNKDRLHRLSQLLHVIIRSYAACNKVLLKSSFFTSGCSIGCSGIIEHTNDFAW